MQSNQESPVQTSQGLIRTPSPVEIDRLRLQLYRSSFEHFCSFALKIKDKQMRLVSMRLNSAQRSIWIDLQRQWKERGYIRSVVLKCRQSGLSTLGQALMAWRIFLNPNVNGLVLAQDTDTAETIFGIARTMYELMPKEIKPVTRYWDRRGFVFEDAKQGGGLRSRMTIGTAGHFHSGVGQTLHALHLTEAARYINPQEIESSIFPTLPDVPGTVAIMESAGWIRGYWFKQICEAAAAGEYGDWSFHFVPWWAMLEYSLPASNEFELTPEEADIKKQFNLVDGQLAWRRKRLEEYLGDLDRFKSQYPATPEEAWIPSGLLAFPPAVVDRLERDVKMPSRVADIVPRCQVFDNPNGSFKIWQEPQAGVYYDIGADVALGLEGGDYSVACVVRRDTLEQVAEWRGYIDPVDFADPIMAMAYWYNEGQIIVEANSIGYATNAEVTRSYHNVYRWRHRDDAKMKITSRTGWWESPRYKELLISYARHLAIGGKVTIRSEILARELRGYVVDDRGRYGAAAGMHDDCVIAWMLALMAANDESFGQFASGEEPQQKTWREPGTYDGGLFKEEGVPSVAAEIASWK